MHEDPDASLDLPPVLVTGDEIDVCVKAILDWRVGGEITKDKQKAVLDR